MAQTLLWYWKCLYVNTDSTWVTVCLLHPTMKVYCSSLIWRCIGARCKRHRLLFVNQIFYLNVSIDNLLYFYFTIYKSLWINIIYKLDFSSKRALRYLLGPSNSIINWALHRNILHYLQDVGSTFVNSYLVSTIFETRQLFLAFFNFCRIEGQQIMLRVFILYTDHLDTTDSCFYYPTVLSRFDEERLAIMTNFQTNLPLFSIFLKSLYFFK